MLLESEQWSSNAGLLTWEVKSLCSKRVVDFTDTQLNTPSPLNASALILNQRDIQSSRCLFRLVLSAHHIEGIESSSLLITPTAVMTCENPDNMRAERKGYQNGTKFGSLESQVMYDPKCSHLLPTPTAIEGEKYTNTFNPQSQMGKSLSAMAGSGMLPTPAARDWKGRTNPGVVKEGSGCKYGETLPDVIWRMSKTSLIPTPTPTATDYQPPYAPDKMITKDGVNRNSLLRSLPTQLGCYIPAKDGVPSRLSPLFTEEMMGFPLMWTSWPFLSESGERSQ